VREKLNKNPLAQVAVIAVLIGAAAFLLLKGGGGGASEGGASPTSTTAVTPASGTAAAAGTSPASATSAGATTTAGATSTAAVSGEAVGAAEASGLPVAVPAPPLPAPVAAAYKANKTVVLLVVHRGGIDDRLVAHLTPALEPLSQVALFVVSAKQISRYAAITLGVEVQNAPALVVVRPRHLSGGTPQATVNYGFQTKQSAVQAVKDADYKGREASYHPN